MKGLPHLGCSAGAPIEYLRYLTLLFISVKLFSISTLKHILNLLSFLFAFFCVCVCFCFWQGRVLLWALLLYQVLRKKKNLYDNQKLKKISFLSLRRFTTITVKSFHYSAFPPAFRFLF